MSINIHVKVSQDRDVYCKDDPAHMILKDHQADKMLKWHCNTGEFKLTFVNESPFELAGVEFMSNSKKFEAVVRDHPELQEGEKKVYVYFVEVFETTEKQPLKADPGLIIQP